MNKKLIEFFKYLGLCEFEINEIFYMCPALEVIDQEKVIECILLLVKYGYPKNEIRDFLLLNPFSVAKSPESLETKLKNLGNNVYEKLTKNPNLI